MKKKTKKALIITLAVLDLIAVAIVGKPREKFSEEIGQTPMRVCFERVNVREKPSTSSEIVGKYVLGEEIQLSGKVVTLFFDEMSEGVWYETRSGHWITAKSVVDLETFDAKFGKY